MEGINLSSWKIPKITQVVYVSNPDRQGFEKQIRVIKDPSIEEIWFEHVKKGNVVSLQQMLSEKLCTIDLPNPEDGDSLAHSAVWNKNQKLLKFALEHKANFNSKTLYDEESVYFSACYGRIGIITFKKIWATINKQNIKDVLLEENGPGKTAIETLCSNNKNLSKLIWIEKKFPVEFTEIKNRSFNNKKTLIEISQEKEAFLITYFLKGLKKLNTELNKTLKNNQKNKKEVFKV